MCKICIFTVSLGRSLESRPGMGQAEAQRTIPRGGADDRIDLDHCEALDAGRPPGPASASVSPCPDGVIYLDGNSLGALPKAAFDRVAQVVGEEWGESLIRGWTAHHWIDLPRRVGDKIGRLIGAEPGEVLVADFDLGQPVQADGGGAPAEAGAPGDPVGALQLPDRSLHRRRPDRSDWATGTSCGWWMERRSRMPSTRKRRWFP